jgi:hypothetical protein
MKITYTDNGRLAADQTSFHPSLVDQTSYYNRIVSIGFLYSEVLPRLILKVEEDVKNSVGQVPGLHQVVVRAVLATMPRQVLMMWADDVLLNGAKKSWTRDRIIDEVTK